MRLQAGVETKAGIPAVTTLNVSQTSKISLNLVGALLALCHGIACFIFPSYGRGGMGPVILLAVPIFLYFAFKARRKPRK